jgi:hypothetical protein
MFFKNIKFHTKSKNININKNGLKKKILKNELNFQKIPKIRFFKKILRKLTINPRFKNIFPLNRTKKSQSFSHVESDLSNINKINQSI